MKSPAFQFYADDFLAGTMNMTDAEVGLYIRLICAQWSAGSLPDDDMELADYGRGETPLRRVRSKFEVGEDGRLRNRRLEAERQKQSQFREKQTNASKRRWDGSGISQTDPRGIPALGIPSHIPNASSPVSSLQSPVSTEKTLHTPTRAEEAPAIEPVAAQAANWARTALPPTLADVMAHATTIGCPPAAAEKFWNFNEASGWTDKHGRAIARWQSSLSYWLANDRARPRERAHHQQPHRAEGREIQETITVRDL